MSAATPPPDASTVRGRMLLGEADLSAEAARRRELKHRLTVAVRALVENAALLDATECDEAAMEAMVDDVGRLSNRIAALPSHRPRGGLNTPDGWESALTERSPISGRSNPLAAPLELWVEGERTFGRAVYGGAYEGPPQTLHGGIVVGAFDELLGVAQTSSGSAGYTGTLTIRMLAPTPLARVIDYEGGVDAVEGRKIFASGRSLVDGRVVGEAEGVFVSPRGFSPGDDPNTVR